MEMRISNMTLQAVVLIGLICVVECDHKLLCETPQYAERGEKGTLECDFPKVFYGVFWYNSSDFLKTEPVAYLKYVDNGREIFESNGYSIHLNGSVVINNVSLQHDRNFTAVILYSINDDYSSCSIDVIVTVKPNQLYPHIEDCNENERACFMGLSNNHELFCSVKDARPAVDLHWYIRSIDNDRLLSSEEFVTPVNALYTTTVATLYNVSYSNGSVVYVCKSNNRHFLLMHEYSVILIQNLRQRYDDVEPETIYAKHLTSVDLYCTNQLVLYLAWKKKSPFNLTVNLVDSLFLSNTSYTSSYTNSLYFTERRSLRINKVDIADEGVYICTFGDGISENIKMLKLQVYVLPDPLHLIIEGCSHQQYCVLFVPAKGELTCVVKGIRPQVKMQWEVARDDQKHFINFSKSDHKIIKNGFKYDIYLTSHFHIQDSLTERFVIRCKAWALNEDPFHLSTEIYLEPLQEDKITGTSVAPNRGLENGGVAAICSILSLIVIAIIVIGIVVLKRRLQETTSQKSEQELDLMANPRSLKETKAIFKQELQKSYQRSWETLRLVPYQKGVNYTVNDIFVASDMQYFEKVAHDEDGNIPIWKKMESHKFFDPLCQRSQKIVLEGEPGYGKTYLGYLFAYEWSIKKSNSLMKDVDIYILLRLRYLKNPLSISKAIKKILLPGDSDITHKEISSVLLNSQPVVIYLDGFDRYFREVDVRSALLNDIYLNTISPNCQFILGTTPNCPLDKKYEFTKYIRLTGFSETNWKKYLKKPVLKIDPTERKAIITILQEHHFLRDLCQCPMFFVWFALIGKDDGNLRRGEFKTLTKFVQTVMNCLHCKMNTVKSHSVIEAFCFDALTSDEKYDETWTKDVICGTLGKDMYEDCRNVGILREKTVSGLYPNSSQRENNWLQHEINVRFFHDIFCQWYAAQQFIKVVTNSSQEELTEYVQKINPFDHQNVYRFACGIDEGVAKRLISCLRDSEQGDKVTILCIQEQPENLSEVRDTIKKICATSVSINAHDTLFLQSSTLELLKFAARENITIEKVVLGQKNSTFDVREESLKLHPDLFLPKLSTLRCLSLRDPSRKFSKKDLKGLLEFASVCQSLERIRFQDCLLPFLKTKNLQRERALLDMKQVVVDWKTPVHGCQWYSLDLKSAKWRREEAIMSKSQYDKMVQTFRASS